MWPLVFVVALAASDVPLTTAQEQEARSLEAALVAPCCWSQQVSVHQSPAANEIRADVRRRLARGETREQILEDYVVQFGERILVEPPARGYNLLLYVFPPVALAISAFGVMAFVRRATGRHEQPAVSRASPEAPPGDAYTSRLDEELRDLD